MSSGNIFTGLHLCSFRNALLQKNIILKLMILTGPLSVIISLLYLHLPDVFGRGW